MRTFIPKCGVCYKIHRFPWNNMANLNKGILISRHSWLVKFSFGEWNLIVTSHIGDQLYEMVSHIALWIYFKLKSKTANAPNAVSYRP